MLGAGGTASSETSTVSAFKKYTFERETLKKNYQANLSLLFSVNATKEKNRVLWIIEMGLTSSGCVREGFSEDVCFRNKIWWVAKS